ncbi:MAG: hypothetical protein K9J79_07720 [Desulfobacteraceae bacterium]|nr:hypothetical protein [Desulfobacteraceae bacterium]
MQRVEVGPLPPSFLSGLFFFQATNSAPGLPFFPLIGSLPKKKSSGNQVDQGYFGGLFRFLNGEMENIQFVDVLKIIMKIALATIRKDKSVPEKIIQAIMDAVMGAVIMFFGLDENKSHLISEC